MIDAATPPENDAADPREMRAGRRLAVLETLTRIGVVLAEALERRVVEAVETGAPIDSGAVALEYARLSRAVRQSLALEARFDMDRATLSGQIAAERQSAREARERARQERLALNTDAVATVVEDAIETHAYGDDTLQVRLLRRLTERLEDPREEDELIDLPVSTTIVRIGRALGVHIDWVIWENEEWAVEEWRQALPGSPFAPKAADAPLVGYELKSEAPAWTPPPAAGRTANRDPPDG